MSAGEWIGTAEIAEILNCSVTTVQRSLRTPEVADAHYGAGNWRWHKSPIERKRVFQVRRAAVASLTEDVPIGR